MDILTLEQGIDDIMSKAGKAMSEHFNSLLKEINPLEIPNCHIVVYSNNPFYHELWLRDVKLGSFKVEIIDGN